MPWMRTIAGPVPAARYATSWPWMRTKRVFSGSESGRDGPCPASGGDDCGESVAWAIGRSCSMTVPTVKVDGRKSHRPGQECRVLGRRDAGCVLLGHHQSAEVGSLVGADLEL